MKAKILMSILVFSASFFSYADAKINSGDACTVVLCMYGKVTGNSESECKASEKKFFSLNAFGKKHRFDPRGTLKMRQSFLGDCATADPTSIADILEKYGKVRG